LLANKFCLATVIDLYSRKVVGWSMSKANDTALVREALQMAINNKPKQQVVLLHSDQGSTYRGCGTQFSVESITGKIHIASRCFGFFLMIAKMGMNAILAH
jgi:hypothetical protein